MKEICLTKGFKAMVDDEDYRWLKQWKWRCYKGGYAARGIGMHRAIYMHKEIARAARDMQVDHINGNRLDNRRSNLRVCTKADNLKNKSIYKNNKSGFKGVYWHKVAQKWVAEIRFDKNKIHLGLFDTVIEAAHAYDVAARKYHGEFARLNFPD